MRYAIAGLLLAAAVVFVAGPAGAVQPSGEVGKVTQRHERRAIGREERDNAFRKPGGILESAKAPRPRVDLERLAERQKALYRGERFTRGLSAAGRGRNSAAGAGQGAGPGVEAPSGPTGTTAVSSGGGLTWLHFVGSAAVCMGLGLLAAWITGRGKRHRAAVRSAPVPGDGHDASAEFGRATRRDRRWIERDLRITMGQREE